MGVGRGERLGKTGAQLPSASSSVALILTVELAVEIRLMDDRAVR